MPHKDPEVRQAYRQAYRLANKEKIREHKRLAAPFDKENAKKRSLRWRQKHREELRGKTRNRTQFEKDKDRARSRQHYYTNQEEYKARSRQRADTHKKELKEQSNQYRIAHRKEIREKDRLRRQANPEKYKERTDNYRILNREKINQRQRSAYVQALRRKWYQENPDKVRAKTQRRRAAKLNVAINDFTAAQWRLLKDHYGHRCVYCDKKPKRLTVDHITPLSKGGNHTMANIVPACGSCNYRKRDRPVPVPVQPLLI
jgi:hypothetical protein